MSPDNEIGLKSVFDNSDFHKGADEYNKDVNTASANTADAGSSMSYVWEGMAAVGEIAFAAIGVAVAAMTAELYLAYDAAADTQDIMTKVDFIVDATANRTGVATEQVTALADSMSKVVPIDDEVIAQAAALGLTFDGVNKDNLQPLLSAAVDLSEFTGKDLSASMKELSLAITDPDKAMRLFRDANITLTDEEKKTMKGLNDTGDTAGTTQFILEQLAKKGILGLGEAMGQTANGKLEIMQTALGNLQESLGGGFLDAVSAAFDKITAFATDPKVLKFFSDLGVTIGQFVSEAVSRIPALIDVFNSLADWFANHKALIIGILAAIGVAMAAFALTVVFSAIAAAEALAPILVAMAVIGAGVALLYTAWTENWGGIQELTAQAWATIQPILQMLWDWLAVVVPQALQMLSEFWTTTLLPAIQVVVSWIVANLVPIFISIVQWLAVNVPAAIATLSAIWSTVLLPAIMAVWSWISTNLIPLFMSISNLMSAVVGLAVTALAGLWQNILLPALTQVWSFISANLTPILQGIAAVVNGTIMPALRPFADFLENVLKAAIDGISKTIATLIGWIDTLTDKIAAIKLPPELTPGSPTPFEIGLKGINQQLKIMSNLRLPAVSTEMNAFNSPRKDVSFAGGGSSANQAGTVNNTSQSIRALLLGAQFNIDSTQSFYDIMSELS